MKKLILFTLAIFCLIFPVLGQSPEFSTKADAFIINRQGVFKGTTVTSNDFHISSTHISSLSGVRHIYYQQKWEGVDILDAVASVHLDRDQNVAHATSGFINASDYAVRKERTLDNRDAIDRVAAYFNLNQQGETKLIDSEEGAGEKKIFSNKSLSKSNMTTKLMYVVWNGNLVLTWEVFIDKADDGLMYLVYVNTQSGEVVKSIPLTVECHFGPGHVHESPHYENPREDRIEQENHPVMFAPNSYLVYPIPLEAPNEGPQSVVTAPWTSASPFGWHDTNGAAGAEFTITRGNNVYAAEDTSDLDVPGFSPDGGANLDFNFSVDTSMHPRNYLSGAITNLFYLNNIMHDVTHNYGFDEAAGNFQVNNYGNGGIGGDAVNADAQDGSGTNNANFGTPIDGSQPRMQMFRWVSAFADLTVNAPGGISGSYTVGGAHFNPMMSSVTGDVVLAIPNEACSAITNPGALSGKIALIDRGNCAFVVKVANAAAAGAIGVIICNHTAGAGVITMAGNGPLSIPAVMLSFEDCQLLKAQLGTGVNVTMNVSTSQFRDSDLDNGIIAHEYGHGISNRLTGGAALAGCLQNNEQMGEGWSDYFALLLQMKPGDMSTDANGIGTYALGEGPDGDGIRPFPYSTDFNVNPFTYNDINGVSIPHGVGSVWCTMLWDMTWNLIAEHGFNPDIYVTTGGNGIALQLVMEGMKLQPCSPGFVDGRDAILEADTLLFGGANSCEIWRAFARRGLGVGASQGSTSSVSDGTESYLTPVSCQCTDQTVSYSGVSIPDGTEDRANTTIAIDNSIIESGDNVSLTAGQEINVQPTFELVNPATLLLDIRPCDDSLLPESIMPRQEKIERMKTSTSFEKPVKN